MDSLENRIKASLYASVDYKQEQVDTVLKLLEEGNTVPFIARYRKEATGSLDEVQIKNIEESYQQIEKLEGRKEEVINSIAKQDKLDEDLKQSILSADKMQDVEDLYLPYKKKRRTKATIAKESGLQALADWLMTFPEDTDPIKEAESYVSKDLEVMDVEDALAGAHEIIAEYVGDRADFRARARQITKHVASFKSKLKDAGKDSKEVYKMYYDYEEKLSEVLDHRVLAVNRGEKEEVLTASIDLNDDQVTDYLLNKMLPKTSNSPAKPYVEKATIDGYKRFIKPAIEREIRNELTDHAEAQAIKVFGENLGHLLLQAPLKDKVIMGFDPAFRTGCKLAIIDETGKLLGVDVIYPHPPASKKQREAAGPKLANLLRDYQVDTIAIGNGTASRESEQFVAKTLKDFDLEISYAIISEAGASVYSASEEARREFPDLEVEERSAVSIARRLQDPLAELVKIDPKSLGVGQYQHDVSQKDLNQTLDFVIETSVNRVGVDVNTASKALLEHVSGLNATTAQNFVDYRNEHGEFSDRKQFKQVPRVGEKSYEQAAGFLRISDGDNPLDQTGIHPESYDETMKILDLSGLSTDDLGSESAQERLKSQDKKALQEETGLGSQTLDDVLQALMQPGRDVRDEMDGPSLKTDVLSMEDLEVGMKLEGTVRNVVDFGAFVDVGVGEDGLVHISKLSTRYVNHPTDIVSTGDIVEVWVQDLDLARNRISLSMVPL